MTVSKIVLPVRPQPDTIIAIFFLRRFGSKAHPCIETAKVVIDPSPNVSDYPDAVFIDIGGGAYDHHGKPDPTTASALVAKSLGVIGDPALTKLLRYTERDDRYGLGTVSKDQLDRTFGLSGLIGALNKQFPHDADATVRIVLPLIEAHYTEEAKRIHEIPAEFAQLKKDGHVTEVDLPAHKLRAVLIESDNIGLPGFLRAQAGGRYDIVVQRRSSGHINILSRPQKDKKIPLERLAALIRAAEYYMETGTQLVKTFAELSVPARISEVPIWYYDQATNSIQNGGVHTDLTDATKIPWPEFRKMLDMAFQTPAVT